VRLQITVIAVVLGLASARTALAAPFLLVHSTPDTWTVLDPAAIQRDSATQHVAAWSVTVQRNLIGSSPPQPGYIRTLNEYDCAERRLQWRSFLAYSRYGALVLRKENAAPDWAPAPEGGEGDSGLRVLCDGAGGGSVIAAQSMAQLVIALMQSWDPAVAAPAGPPAAAARPPVAKPGAKH
jgi:hypothetical protein